MNRSKQEPVELELKVKFDREMSYGVKHPNDPNGRRIIFLPKSIVERLTEVGELPGDLTRFSIPEWFAMKEGLV